MVPILYFFGYRQLTSGLYLEVGIRIGYRKKTTYSNLISLKGLIETLLKFSPKKKKN